MSFNDLQPEAVLSLLGARLRRARLDANLTQRALATSAGVSLKTVRNAEEGQNISLETLIQLLAGVGRLDEFQTFLQADGPSPVELAERRGRQRQRATGSRSANKGPEPGWEW